jgi:hypothetical protein
MYLIESINDIVIDQLLDWRPRITRLRSEPSVGLAAD